MKKILILAFLLLSLGTYAQREVPQSRMEQIYEEAKTPYKYGLAVAPADNKHKIDCPTVFREGDKWYRPTWFIMVRADWTGVDTRHG